MTRPEGKAASLVTAWRRRYGSPPSRHAALLVLAVAEHETRCGDAWPGEHNWGAVQRRAMTADERALEREGKVPPPRDAFEALHGDSSPVNGKYRACFWRFPSDIEGADKLLEVLLDKRPSIKKDVDALTPGELAERMYRTRYYEGFHDPRPAPGEQVLPGGLTRGQRANVADYAKGLARAFAAFDVALAGWSPVDGGTPAEPDLATTLGHQAALRALGFDPGPLDGVPGPRTRAAVRAFQADEERASEEGKPHARFPRGSWPSAVSQERFWPFLLSLMRSSLSRL